MTLPKSIRESIWDAYRPGQEEDGEVSEQYLAASERAFAWIRTYEAHGG